jgi:hypothetical protein
MEVGSLLHRISVGADRGDAMVMKKLWVVLAAVTACLGLLGSLWVWIESEPISPAKYKNIRLGMSEVEVEAVVGLPAGDYHTFQLDGSGCTNSLPWAYPVMENGIPCEELGKDSQETASKGTTVKNWWGDNYSISVAFDENGKTIQYNLFRVDRPGSSDPIRRLLQALFG